MSRSNGIRVAVVCSGLGRVVRGFERFFYELARALRDEVDVKVFAGRLPAGVNGHTPFSLSRGFLGRAGFSPERAYYWEQVTFGAGLAPYLLSFRPHIVHLSDPALTNLLLRIRELVPGRPRLLYCNGGPLSPHHYRRYDHVQLVAPWQLDEAHEAGVDPARVTCIPHGVDTGRFHDLPSSAKAREQLELPPGPLLISVAALNSSHKRLDYVIREVGRREAGPWTLVCLGQPTTETLALERLAALVAPSRVLFRSVPADLVPLYLAAADVFVLASRNEGFGLAAVEAMAASLPVVLRDVPSLRYLVDDEAQLDPLAADGALVRRLAALQDPQLRRLRGERNRARAVRLFDWTSVLPAYLALYTRLAGGAS